MHPPFTINFRREVFRRERERSRKRLFQLGGWVSYFGLLLLLIGLYGLNCQWVSERGRTIEGQVERMRRSETADSWQPASGQFLEMQRQRASAARWRDRLERLSVLLPPQAILSSVAVNPDNLPGTSEQNTFQITGSLRARPGSGSMSEVVIFVSSLKSDTLFARGFNTFRLTSSEMVEGPPPTVNFVVECR